MPRYQCLELRNAHPLPVLSGHSRACGVTSPTCKIFYERMVKVANVQVIVPVLRIKRYRPPTYPSGTSYYTARGYNDDSPDEHATRWHGTALCWGTVSRPCHPAPTEGLRHRLSRSARSRSQSMHLPRRSL